MRIIEVGIIYVTPWYALAVHGTERGQAEPKPA
jgi:hypothetical protein